MEIMAENGRWAAAVLVLCIALQKCWTVNAVAVYLGQRNAKYMNLPYFFEAPVENIQPHISGYACKFKTPELSQFLYPVYSTVHETAGHLIPQHECESEHSFQPVEELSHPLFAYPYFLRRKPTEEKTQRMNLFLAGREQAPLGPYDAGCVIQYTTPVPAGTLIRQQRQVSIMLPSVNPNTPRNSSTAVVIVEEVTYMLTSNLTSKKVKKSYRRKRSLDLDESSLTLDNWSQVRNKREITQPMYVSLMDTLNDKARLRTRPSRRGRTDSGNRFTENSEISDCTSSYCKKSTENNLQLNTQEYLDKLKRDFEAIKSTIETRRQAILNKSAEAKAKFQKENSLGKLYERRSKDNERRLPGIKINTKYNLLGTNNAKNENSGRKPKGVYLHDLEDDIMNSNEYRETKNSKDLSVDNYGESSGFNGNSGSSYTQGEGIVTKLLMKKIVEEPTLMKFINDYLLRFVNVTTMFEKENGDTMNKSNYQNAGESLNDEHTRKASKVNVKRSDGNVCDATSSSEHMCAHATPGHIRNGKNSKRRLKKNKMEGVDNVGLGDNLSSFKLPYNGSGRYKNAQEEQGTCKCFESSLNENKYGNKANAAVFPKTSSLNAKRAIFGRQKTNQELPKSKLFNDAVRDSHSSLLDDLAELLQDQNCNCPRAKAAAVTEGV